MYKTVFVDLKGWEKNKVSIISVCCHRDKQDSIITRLRISIGIEKTFSPGVKNYFRGASMGENLGNADLQYTYLLLCNA